MRHAFLGLTQNAANSAVVWNNERRAFVGMLSISDFLEILFYVLQKARRQELLQNLKTYDPNIPYDSADDLCPLSSVEDIATLRISEWQQIMWQNNRSVPKLLSIAPESTLLEVCLRYHLL